MAENNSTCQQFQLLVTCCSCCCLSGKFPALEAWFDAMESRSSYLGTKSDHYTHCHDLPPQLGGEGTEELLPVDISFIYTVWPLESVNKRCCYF